MQLGLPAHQKTLCRCGWAFLLPLVSRLGVSLQWGGAMRNPGGHIEPIFGVATFLWWYDAVMMRLCLSLYDANVFGYQFRCTKLWWRFLCVHLRLCDVFTYCGKCESVWTMSLTKATHGFCRMDIMYEAQCYLTLILPSSVNSSWHPTIHTPNTPPPILQIPHTPPSPPHTQNSPPSPIPQNRNLIHPAPNPHHPTSQNNENKNRVWRTTASHTPLDFIEILYILQGVPLRISWRFLTFCKGYPLEFHWNS